MTALIFRTFVVICIQWKEENTHPPLFISMHKTVQNLPEYESAQELAHLPPYKLHSPSTVSPHLSKQVTQNVTCALSNQAESLYSFQKRKDVVLKCFEDDKYPQTW